MKKILSTALALIVAAQGAIALAAGGTGSVSVKPVGAEGKMTVNVTLPDSYENREVYVYVLNPGTNLDMLADNDMAKNIAVIQYNGQKPYAIGGITFDFVMNTQYVDSQQTPVYTLWATAEDATAMSFDFTYYDITTKQETISSVNSKTVTAQDVENIKEVFTLQYVNELYAKAPASTVAQKLNALSDGDVTVSETEEIFVEGCLLAAAASGKLTVEDLVQYNKYVGVEDAVVKEIEKLKDSGKAIFTTDTMVDVTDTASLKTAATKALLTAAVYGNVNEGNGILAEVISAHEDFFAANGLNISHFNSLDKNNAGKNILSGSRLTFDSLVSTLNNMTAQSTSSGGATGGGSSGGSSSGKKGSTSAFPIVPNTTTTEEKVSSFDDIGEAEWARESIERLYFAGVVSGKEYGKFMPNDIVTREEFVQMIVKAFGIEKGKEVASFDDVPANRWSYTAVTNAASNLIVVGDGTSFRPSDCITREDMATILIRVLKHKETYPEIADYSMPFEDLSEISEYAVESVNILYHNRVVSGRDNNMFAPKANATRAEAARMICGALDLMK